MNNLILEKLDGRIRNFQVELKECTNDEQCNACLGVRYALGEMLTVREEILQIMEEHR